MPDVLNIQSTVQCPHGGTVQLFTTNTRVRADGAFAMILGDSSVVAGCPFAIGLKPSPCVLVQWISGPGRASAGPPLLNQSSIGLCQSPEGAPQGVAIISNTQTKVVPQ
jgi:hypothetical protein